MMEAPVEAGASVADPVYYWAWVEAVNPKKVYVKDLKLHLVRDPSPGPAKGFPPEPRAVCGTRARGHRWRRRMPGDPSWEDVGCARCLAYLRRHWQPRLTMGGDS